MIVVQLEIKLCCCLTIFGESELEENEEGEPSVGVTNLAQCVVMGIV